MSRLNNVNGYDRAKTESEPEALNLLKALGYFDGRRFESVRMGDDGEDKAHKDIIAICVDNSVMIFDVKDQEGNNRGRDTYSVSKSLYDYIQINKIQINKNPDSTDIVFENSYFMMREYDGHRPTGRYIMLKFKDAQFKTKIKDGKTFYLIKTTDRMTRLEPPKETQEMEKDFMLL